MPASAKSHEHDDFFVENRFYPLTSNIHMNYYTYHDRRENHIIDYELKQQGGH